MPVEDKTFLPENSSVFPSGHYQEFLELHGYCLNLPQVCTRSQVVHEIQQRAKLFDI